MENIEVLGCSAQKGGIFDLTERSSLLIKNGTFTNNSADSGGIIFALEDYDSNITLWSSNFISNQGNDTLIDLSVANVTLIDVNFLGNINTLFLISQSTIFLSNVNISFHICTNYLQGCIISSILFSNVFSEKLILFKVNHEMEDGIIYLEDSTASFNNVLMQFCNTLTEIGTCFELENSSISVHQGSFISFTYNCIYAEKSSLIIKNSLFYNQSFYNSSTNSLKLGAVVCQFCQNLYFFACNFIEI